MHTLAQAPLGPDVETTTDQQHPQFRSDRWTTRAAAEPEKCARIPAKPPKIYAPVNRAPQVTLRHMAFPRQPIEQRRPRFFARSHQTRPSRLLREQNQRPSTGSKSSFLQSNPIPMKCCMTYEVLHDAQISVDLRNCSRVDEVWLHSQTCLASARQVILIRNTTKQL